MMAPGNAARAPFAFGLAPRILGRGVFIRPDGRHLDEQPRLGVTRCLGRGFCAEGVHGVEALCARGIENARQVDDGIGTLASRGQRGRVAHIGLHHHDLAGIAEGLQVAGEIGPAAGHADPVSTAGQRPHDVPAKETRSADDGDESVGWLNEHGNHPDVVGEGLLALHRQGCKD